MASNKTESVEQEMVEIKLFKDNNRYKDDVFVGINGRTYMIKRGEKVKVPAIVAEIIEQSLDQDNQTADMIDRLSSGAAY